MFPKHPHPTPPPHYIFVYYRSQYTENAKWKSNYSRVREGSFSQCERTMRNKLHGICSIQCWKQRDVWHTRDSASMTMCAVHATLFQRPFHIHPSHSSHYLHWHCLSMADKHCLELISSKCGHRHQCVSLTLWPRLFITIFVCNDERVTRCIFGVGTLRHHE